LAPAAVDQVGDVEHVQLHGDVVEPMRVQGRPDPEAREALAKRHVDFVNPRSDARVALHDRPGLRTQALIAGDELLQSRRFRRGGRRAERNEEDLVRVRRALWNVDQIVAGEAVAIQVAGAAAVHVVVVVARPARIDDRDIGERGLEAIRAAHDDAVILLEERGADRLILQVAGPRATELRLRGLRARRRVHRRLLFAARVPRFELEVVAELALYADGPVVAPVLVRVHGLEDAVARRDLEDGSV